MSIKTSLRTLGLGALIATLTACGGGASDPSASSPLPPNGAPPPVGISSATVVSGTVTGFGGVVIDGVTYGETNATVALDINPAAETPGSMADVKLGQQVEALANENGQLSKLVVRATVIGPVTSVNAAGGSFVVLGQTVKVVATGEGKTVLDGIATLNDLKANDWVEVHGTLDAVKNVVATRVEVKPATGSTAVRVGGVVKGLNANAKTFTLGTLTINFTNATVLPQGAAIENDVLVVVYSDALPANNTLAAKTVRVVKAPTLEGRRFSLGGLVTDVTEAGKKFKVAGLAVDATDPAVEVKGGQSPSFADIKPMALVRVEGTLTGSANAAVLKATRIWIIPASEQRKVSLVGQVTDYVSAANFKVRGVQVDADAARFIGGVKGDLKANVFVAIMGRIDGTKVVAEEVRFTPPPSNVPFRLVGLVSGYNAGTGAFSLLGIPMQLDPAATFEAGAKADFKDGAVVSVRGSFNGTVFVVTQVKFEPTASPLAIRLDGVLTGLTLANGVGEFTLNGTKVKVNAQTKIENGPLANNQRVEVKATLMGADVVALEVEVQTTVATQVMLRGPVMGLVGMDFTVNGQAVAVSAGTVFKGGAAGDLSNGDLVRVTGPLVAGKVQAAMVQFLR
jgi:hypothetical protein